MINEVKQKEIDGIEVQVVPFDGLTALRLKARLIKKIAPGFGMFLGSLSGDPGKTNLTDMAIDGETLRGAFQTFLDGLSEDEFIELVKTLLAKVTCVINEDGKKLTFPLGAHFQNGFDKVFTGKLMSVYKVIAFVLEVNYPDFFGKAQNIGNLATTFLSNEPKISPSSSGKKSEKSEQ